MVPAVITVTLKLNTDLWNIVETKQGSGGHQAHSTKYPISNIGLTGQYHHHRYDDSSYHNNVD